MVNVRLPKPLHGWREFGGEVGVIVLGVLIALAAAQVVDALRWRQDVAQANQALAIELGDAVGQAHVRVWQSPCVEARLDALARIVDKAETDGRLPPIGRLPTPRYFTWARGVWDSILSSQIASHYDRHRLDGVSGIYQYISNLNAEQLRELDVWNDLFTLVGPGHSFDHADAAAARKSISQARFLGRLIGRQSVRLVQSLKLFGVRFDSPTAQSYFTPEDERAGRCLALDQGKVGHYGEAAMSGAIEDAIAHPF